MGLGEEHKRSFSSASDKYVTAIFSQSQTIQSISNEIDKNSDQIRNVLAW
jgi:hypothetical protein